MEVVHPGLGSKAVVAKPNSLILEPRMDIHKNARMTVRGRALLVERIGEQGWPVVRAASASGISQRTAYKWLCRYRAGGESALHDRRSAPWRSPRRTPAATVAAIERLRRDRLSGPRIARRLGLPVSTVGAVLRRLGLGRLKLLDERPEIVRYERATPGELIHIDTKKLGRIDGIGHRITGERTNRKRGLGWEYLHVAIDDCSRLAYTELLPAETGVACAGFLARAAAWFAGNGVAVRRVMTDNAFAYTNSRIFKATLAGVGARHITTRPYRPRTNGKAERFIQTALREWLYARAYTQSADRDADMPGWLHWYNHHRPHSALKAVSPASRLNNLLANDT
jgi:transposase InsO family protein